ncbi:immune inhibitor A domain-containing protein [Streptodolium elevatio]|uniref:Immune inhibitor A domain-containing protein n=1 Tax=Streptodolium elevatio TaxID=3157996 RepID=A0ABV3DEG5_9ACTN
MRPAAALAVAGLACCLLAGTGQGPGGATAAGSAESPAPAPTRAPALGDDLPGPFTESRRTQRDAAVSSVVTASQSLGRGPHSAPDVVELPKGPKVQLRPPSHARVFVILVEFGDRVARAADQGGGPAAPPEQPGTDPEQPGSEPASGGLPGPRHATIPEPDRSLDTTTVWHPTFDRGYFHEIFFGDGSHGPSLATHYRAQSSGRMEIDGNVTDWVRVPWNEARYGNNNCGSQVCTNAWDLVRDAMNEWAGSLSAHGLSTRQISDALAPFDLWDRDDHDRDGVFDEPDGYIDHLEIVKAGVDEAAGGGAQGADALWSHRWYAYGDQAGRTGPPGNLAGGTRVGGTGMWAGDYTLQAENGGLGVIAHEFGHDLGLPDLYDRRDALSGSPVGFWSLMGLGGYLGDGGTGGVGNSPGSLSAWDRMQLGWLDWMIADPKTATTTMLAPLQSTGDPQAVLIPLPARKGSTKPRWYVVENRQYAGTDAVLRTGPYDGQAGTEGSSHFPYGSGVMVWLWDASYADNDVADHPGQGLILPVDAHPDPLMVDGGTPARGRLATFDAPFSAAEERTDPVLIGSSGRRTTLGARPGTPAFDDRSTAYWSSRAPLAGVKVAAAGVRVEVDGKARTGEAVRVTVKPS